MTMRQTLPAFSDSTPASNASVPSPGSSFAASRSDHVHRGVSILRTTADQLLGSSYENVTNLQVQVDASTAYAFDFYVVFQTADATCGFAFAINAPGSPALISYTVEYQTTALATDSTDVFTQRVDTGNDAMAATATTVTASVNLVARIRGAFVNGTTAGDLNVRGKSETGSNITVKAGSWGIWF